MTIPTARQAVGSSNPPPRNNLELMRGNIAPSPVTVEVANAKVSQAGREGKARGMCEAILLIHA